MTRGFQLGDCRVGGAKTFVIAEAGVNHNNDFEIAARMIDAAKAAGADAVKFQSFRAAELVSGKAAPAHFEILRGLELSDDMHVRLFDYCRKAGILFLSTPFDEKSADLLEKLPVEAFKIASGELTVLPFLRHVARKRKPILLSTGMADLAEVREAFRALRSAGARDIALLHCTSTYPAKLEEVNLRAIQTLAKIFKVPVGFSDHTLGIEAAIAAVALGACVIEKHFTLDKNLPGPDHSMSADPRELARLIEAIRGVESALGTGMKQPAERELVTASAARRSLVALTEIPAGKKVRAEMIGFKRPGTGLPPAKLSQVVGKKASQTIPEGALISTEMLG